MEHILTSEAVTRGHPDKICDQIADAVLDAVLAEEPEARVACEAAVWENGVCLFGELTAEKQPDYETIVRRVIREIGYDRPELGFDWETCSVQVHMHPQSPDIARGVRHRAAEDTGAGDQGILFGYACRETEDLMPLPITLANRLARRLEAVGRDGTLPWLRPDGKTQVSVAYRDGKDGFYYIKRFNVTSITRDREYDLTQGKPFSRVVYFTANPNGEAEVIKITLKPALKLKKIFVE